MAESTVDSRTLAATVVTPGDEVDNWTQIYTLDGAPVRVPAGTAEHLLSLPQFTAEPFNFDDVVSDWLTSHRLVEAAVLGAVEILKNSHYQPDVAIAQMNVAVKQTEEKFATMARAIGALFPTEGEVKSRAVHKRLHGDHPRGGLPGVNATADAFAAAHPEDVKAAQSQAEAESARSLQAPDDDADYQERMTQLRRSGFLGPNEEEVAPWHR